MVGAPGKSWIRHWLPFSSLIYKWVQKKRYLCFSYRSGFIGGFRGTRPFPRSNFFYFHAVFYKYFWALRPQFWGWCPPPPVWEIMSPPLGFAAKYLKVYPFDLGDFPPTLSKGLFTPSGSKKRSKNKQNDQRISDKHRRKFSLSLSFSSGMNGP